MERVRPTRLDRCQYARLDRELRSTTVCRSATVDVRSDGKPRAVPSASLTSSEASAPGTDSANHERIRDLRRKAGVAINGEGLVARDGSVASSTQRVKVGRDDETHGAAQCWTSSARCREGTTDGRSRRLPR